MPQLGASVISIALQSVISRWKDQLIAATVAIIRAANENTDSAITRKSRRLLTPSSQTQKVRFDV